MKLLATAFSRTDPGGVYSIDFDPETASFAAAEHRASLTGCLHAHWSPGLRRLFVAGNTFPAAGGMIGQLTIIQADPHLSGIHTIGSAPTDGRVACYASYSIDRDCAYIANYGSASLTTLKLTEEGEVQGLLGKIELSGSGPDPERQKEPHPHCALFNSHNRMVWLADLGTDRVTAYTLDDNGGFPVAEEAITIQLPPGAGPRHVIFHPWREVAYVTNELNSTVSVVELKDKGWQRGRCVTTVKKSSNPKNFISTAALDPEARFLVVANRGDDTLAILNLGADGYPETDADLVPANGAFPTFLSFAPDGKWLFVANQRSNSITAFAVDVTIEGMSLQPAATVEVPEPTFVQVVD